MRRFLFAGLVLISASGASVPTVDVRADDNTTPLMSVLQQKKWIHGAADCKSNADPAIEIFRYDRSSFILRQNKCLSFEAPFIYVMLGEDKVLVLDTGATESASKFPIYDAVQSLIVASGEQADRQVLVIHSHSHGDHNAGDPQFEGQPNVTLVEPNKAAINEFFAFGNWPENEAYVDLGDRKLTIIPTPGHQEESISVYDPQTKWLLTGDTIYPGYIYVKHWGDYKKSISRLAEFSKTHEVSAVLGAHIEMTNKAGEYYPIGTIYQPDESSLALTKENLVALDSEFNKSDKPRKIILGEFIVAPMNALQKTLSNVARWFTQ